MTVHVVGNLCFDTTLMVPRFPEPGETLVALGSRSGLGGKGVNQAVAASRSDAAVVLHAAVGEADIASARHLLAHERLVPRLTRVHGPSDTSTILVRPDGENAIVSVTGCALGFDPAAAPGFAEVIEPGDCLLMQGNLSMAATRACLAEARSRLAFTVLNPSPLWAEAEDFAWDEVDCLVMNAGELRAVSGEADPDRGVAALRGRGAAAVAVTLGARGACYRDAEGRIDVEAPTVVVHDTSGAGDVFCGVLVAVLARGGEHGEALARATAAASLSVTRPGALASCPSAAELAALAVPPWSRRSR